DVRYPDGVQSSPFLQTPNTLEHRLPSAIRTLPTTRKPASGFREIAAPQTPPQARRSFEALRQQLEQTYTVHTVALSDSTIPPDLKALIFARTPDSLRGAQAGNLKAFVDRGGSMLLMASGMERSPQGPFSFSRPVGWNELLKPYGVSIGSDMVYDLAANARVAIQAQFGQVLLPYPFWVQAASTKASPVNAELDAVL